MIQKSLDSFIITAENIINFQTKARYRLSKQTLPLASTYYLFTVPSKLEVLNTKNQWQQHPVVLVCYANPDAYFRGEGNLVIMLSDGDPFHLHFKNHQFDLGVYRQANNFRLLEGSIFNIQEIR